MLFCVPHLHHRYKIENGNGECVKKTTILPNKRKQTKATNGSSILRENPAFERVLQLALNKNVW